MAEGTSTAGAMLVPFVGVIIACNLFAVGAQKFFLEALMYRLGGEMPNNPLFTSDYALRLMSAVGVLAPIGAVAILPRSVFGAVGRSATIGGILAAFAGWSFYGAVLSVFVHFVSGALVTVDLQLGLTVYTLLAVPMIAIIFVLTLFFWFRILLSVLGLGGSQVAVISVAAALAIGVLIGFASFIGSAAS